MTGAVSPGPMADEGAAYSRHGQTDGRGHTVQVAVVGFEEEQGVLAAQSIVALRWLHRRKLQRFRRSRYGLKSLGAMRLFQGAVRG